MSTQRAQYVLLFLEQYSMLNGLYAHNVHVFLRNTAIYIPIMHTHYMHAAILHYSYCKHHSCGEGLRQDYTSQPVPRSDIILQP